MSRQADMRSLFVSRKSGEKVRHTALCDRVNPYNRYSLLMSDRFLSSGCKKRDYSASLCTAFGACHMPRCGNAEVDNRKALVYN
jgi:hypothetical protein